MGSTVPSSGPQPETGLFGSVKALAVTLLAIAHTRLDLLSTEVEEEWIRLSSILLWIFAALFCAALGVVFALVLLVVLLWDTHRVLALAIPALVFLSAAVFSGLVARGKFRAKPRVFSASLAELAKDRELFKPRS